MAEILKLVGSEQTFTSANTFSNTAANVAAGWNLVRIANIGTGVGVVTVNTNPTTNCSVLGGTSIIVEKASNTTITASSANLLGVAVSYKST